MKTRSAVISIAWIVFAPIAALTTLHVMTQEEVNGLTAFFTSDSFIQMMALIATYVAGVIQGFFLKRTTPKRG